MNIHAGQIVPEDAKVVKVAPSYTVQEVVNKITALAIPDPAKGAAGQEPRCNQEIHQYTLLYIEDNPENMQLVKRIIAHHPNIKLLTELNGIAGIYTARLHKPDVILTDINLPCISGFEVLRLLRSDPDTASIPVVAISANVLPQDIEKAMEAGFFRYITKPARVGELLDGLALALEFSRKMSSAKAFVMSDSIDHSH